MPKQLAELPEIGPEIAHLMNWYYQVRGASKLTWVEIKAWSELTCTNLKPYEAEALMVLDTIYWSTVNG